MGLTGAHTSYRENSIYTASPEELTLMLYNGLIRFVSQAQKAVEEKDYPQAHEGIMRAQDIILEFMTTLDMQYPVAQNLMLLYDYMHRRLIDANVRKSAETLEEVLGFARELRDTWAQAMKIAKQERAGKKEDPTTVS